MWFHESNGIFLVNSAGVGGNLCGYPQFVWIFFLFVSRVLPIDEFGDNYHIIYTYIVKVLILIHSSKKFFISSKKMYGDNRGTA